MTKEYLVIKPFSCAQVGDVFRYVGISEIDEDYENQQECGYYEMTNDTDDKMGNTTFRNMEINVEHALELEKDGFLGSNVITSEEKIEKLSQLIDELLIVYSANNNKIADQHKYGTIPTCVKVECETVYFNMTKLLNKFKEIINE